MRVIAYGLGVAALIGCTNSAAQESRAAPGDDQAERRVAATETRRDYDLSGFARVSLATPDTVEIRQGAVFSIRAEGHAEILNELELTVENGTLRIGYRDDHDRRRWRRPDHRPATISIVMPGLNGVSLAGSGDMDVGQFASQGFEASIAGSGNIAIQSLQTDRAAFEIAGSGDLSVAGTADSIELDIAGSGDVAAGEFRARTLDVSIAGSGDVEAYVTENVEASFIGSGDVTVRGGAQCRSSAIGSGALRCS
ncbi:head GIN domain-containing protein [Parasphingopyxis lamellibrachiae]|uniref:Putative autotransporter adhesin-like protein n=1 Tax=Parasphingopyxis lamellibrachiae TaxID=680125 RepID=A0A3D9FGL2_9SPHN|nr:head GIN domain-containing protein [Parasphingopyxis lamellibrachiae]RED16955.1 putative autotransporter adhesin-like protein [Parasphingopyxis lamellibrachiae]